MLFLEFGGERAYAFANCGVHDVGCNTGQWLKYKVAQMHEWVRDCEPRGLDGGVAIEQYVNVYDAIVIFPACGFSGASQFALNALGSVE